MSQVRSSESRDGLLEKDDVNETNWQNVDKARKSRASLMCKDRQRKTKPKTCL